MSKKPIQAQGVRPCPFCGTGHIWLKQGVTKILECNGCHAFMIDHEDGVQRDVYAAWNRRSEPKTIEQQENQ
jgi:hypothetical protein